MTRNLLTHIRLLFCIALVLLVSHQAALAQDHAAKIQELLALAHKYRQFNGSALVAENGKVTYKGAFGMANMEWNIPNTPDTKFRLGSITKQFTATVILQLVEQGKIKLDAKLSDYLPEYRKDVGDKVTIHHLLTHTSGIPSYTGQPGFQENVSRNPYKVDEFVKKYASGNLEFEPGSKYSYNNSGYFLLGAIIERVTGKPYEQVLKENIFDPLGMKTPATIITPRSFRNAPPVTARRLTVTPTRSTSTCRFPTPQDRSTRLLKICTCGIRRFTQTRCSQRNRRR